MVEEEKKIFSLNLVSYLKSQGLQEDYLSRDGNAVYYVFPENVEVAKAIIRYRYNKELQEFLQAYRKVRQQISEFEG